MKTKLATAILVLMFAVVICVSTELYARMVVSRVLQAPDEVPSMLQLTKTVYLAASIAVLIAAFLLTRKVSWGLTVSITLIFAMVMFLYGVRLWGAVDAVHKDLGYRPELEHE